MTLTVTCVDGVHECEGVSRYKTDEHNNLCVYAGDQLIALYVAEQWRSAVLLVEEV